jgi:hypothetical protein
LAKHKQNKQAIGDFKSNEIGVQIKLHTDYGAGNSSGNLDLTFLVRRSSFPLFNKTYPWLKESTGIRSDGYGR